LPPPRATFAAGGDDGLVDPKPQVGYCMHPLMITCY
jgi:hypothetical protein